jgi:predicted GNAT family acetyltransferase
MEDTQFTDNASQHQFELRSGSQLAAIAQYRLQDGTVTFTHTEVLPGNEGKGLGSQIAKQALQEVQRRNMKVVAQCEFIAGYIGKHPEFAPLLAG